MLDKKQLGLLSNYDIIIYAREDKLIITINGVKNAKQVAMILGNGWIETSKKIGKRGIWQRGIWQFTFTT